MATASPKCRRASSSPASRANAPFAVIQDEKRKYYGLMFHPEVVHTPDGAKLIRNFVRKVAGLTGDWTMRAFREEAIEKIRDAGRQGQGDLRPLRRRRFRRRRRADPRGDRRPAHLRVRRSRPAAARTRPRPWSTCSGITTTSRWCTLMPSKQFLGELAGVTDPEAEAQDHRPALHRRVRRGGQEDRRRRNFWRRARSIPT